MIILDDVMGEHGFSVPKEKSSGTFRHGIQSPMADQLLTTAPTWGIAGSLFLLVAGGFWLARQAYHAARGGLCWCWRRCVA